MFSIAKQYIGLQYIGLLAIFTVVLLPMNLLAQVRPPDGKFIFQEDTDQAKAARSKTQESLRVTAKPGSGKIDFSAPTVHFDQAENIVSGEGGVIISGEGIRLQGERGSVDMDSHDVTLEERVLISSDDTSIQAEKSEFNLDTEAGNFEDARFTLEDGAYRFEAEEAQKLNDTDFELSGCLLSTCSCSEGETPWTLSASRAHAEREGYAHLYNSVFRFHGVPLFYSPWLAVPIKQERSSGLLVPEFGYGSRDGLRLKLPLYAVIDGSSDATITPFTETKTRRGLQVDYREAYSRRSSFEGRVIYSDETPRDGDLRGTNITGVAEPEIDQDRGGAYVAQRWSTSSTSDVPLSFVSDIHWVSDTLFLREIRDDKIGLQSSRYATSRVVLRGQFGDYVSSSLVGEWNKNLVGVQDTTLQRLPEFSLNAIRSFRPFGSNPYGLKVTPRFDVKAVNFDRTTGFDGTRLDLNPSLKVPFHYKNYFSSEASLGFHQTSYELDQVESLTGGSDLDSSTDRQLWQFDYQIRTAIERIFDLPEDSLLATITSLGSRNQTHRLRRVKNTVEPKITFSYVPGTHQEDLPLFDSFDRVRKKSLITYEVMTRLIGSFDYQQGASRDIEEFTDDVDEYQALDTLSPLTDFDLGTSLPGDTFGVPLVAPQRNSRANRELASLRLVQSYDYIEDQLDLDPNRSPFSDVGAQLYLTPTQDFGFGAGTNYNAEDREVSSWSLASHLYDDRGDSVRARYTFVDQNVSQVEGNLEVVLNSRLKLGYYARFDDRQSEFIEQQTALRLSSACDCWHVDIGFTDQINPDTRKFLFQFTLRGLGDLTQQFGLNDNREKNSL